MINRITPITVAIIATMIWIVIGSRIKVSADDNVDFFVVLVVALSVFEIAYFTVKKLVRPGR